MYFDFKDLMPEIKHVFNTAFSISPDIKTMKLNNDKYKSIHTVE